MVIFDSIEMIDDSSRADVSQFSKVLGSCQMAGPIGPKFGIHVQIYLGMDIRQTNLTFKSMLKLSNGWTDWHQIWHTCAD